MANVTISGLSTAATTLNDADLFETEQGGSSKKVAASVIADYLAGGGLSDGVKLGGTAAANLLDDYEEGTWTPTYTTGGTDFDSVTYNSLTAGRYTKIGNLVHVQGLIYTNSITKGSASGPILISGLPFTSIPNTTGTNDGFAPLSIVTVGTFLDDYPNAGRVNQGATNMTLFFRAAPDGASTSLEPSDLGTGANSNGVYFSGSYIAS